MATSDDFLKLNIHADEIMACEPFPKAQKPAYKLTVDFGPEIGSNTPARKLPICIGRRN